MTEQQGKFIVKHFIDNGFPKLDESEKEFYKQAVDNTKNFDELFAVITDMINLSNSK